jgi:hypothetical protein
VSKPSNALLVAEVFKEADGFEFFEKYPTFCYSLKLQVLRKGMER